MSQCSLPRTERRWSRAFAWSAVCSVAGAGSWLLCLLVSRWVFGPWYWFEADAEQTAIASATYCVAFGGWGLLVGGVAGRRTRRGIVRPALALAATGGFAGLLLPILVLLTRGTISPDLGSSLAFALAGSVAGLIAGLRANARQPSEERCYWAVASAVAAGGSWAITAWVVQWFFEFRITQRFDLTLSQHFTFLTGIGAAWGILGGGFLGLRCKRNIAMWSASGAAIGALTGSVLSLLESVEVGQQWLAIASLMVGIAGLASGWTAHLPTTAPARLPKRLVPIFATICISLIVCELLVIFELEIRRSFRREIFWMVFLSLAMCGIISILIRQQVRIQKLERRLRELDPAVGTTALPGVTSSPVSVPDTPASPSPECKEDPR